MALMSFGSEKCCRFRKSPQAIRLIKLFGRRAQSVSETISEVDGSLIRSQQWRFIGWEQHFKAQVSWASALASPTAMSAHFSASVSINPSSLAETCKEVRTLGLHKAKSPDGIRPAV